MKVRLMDPDRDVALGTPDPEFADDLVRDLELDILWDPMGAGDRFLRAVARAGMLHLTGDPAIVRWRQAAYADVCAHPRVVTELYQLAVEALGVQRGILMFPLRGHPAMTLSHSVQVLSALADRLVTLRDLCAQAAPTFSSAAFTDMFAVIAAELDDAYLQALRAQLKELAFTRGMLFSAAVGHDGRVLEPVLRVGKRENQGLFDRTRLKRPIHSFTIPERDEAGFTALDGLRERAVADVADATATAVEHVLGYFRSLRVELGFYLSVRAGQQAVEATGVRTCVPDIVGAPGEDDRTRAVDLCDPCLALRTGKAPVASDLDPGCGNVLVITGANHGGKSTFLRALGVAQLMAQAGVWVTASAFRAPVAGHVLTHWAREEDENLVHGKLDEELTRMSALVDVARPGDVLLCNESFASTNEIEGSQIAWDVTSALAAVGVRVRFVTHQYDFARTVAASGLAATFLRAPRAADGSRSYRLEPGPPLRTSFAADVYDRVFGTRLAGAA